MTTPSQFYGQNKVKIPQPGADEKHKGTQPLRGCVKFTFTITFTGGAGQAPGWKN